MGYHEMRQQAFYTNLLASYFEMNYFPSAIEPIVEKSALARIIAGEGSSRRYLLQWNHQWGAFNLIGGKVDNACGDQNSFMRTICREIEEEMGLSSPRDFFIVKELKQIYLRQYSQRTNHFKNYHFSIFAVELFPELALDRNRLNTFARWLSTGRENIYVSVDEICRLRTCDNRPISMTTRYILNALDELTPVPFSDSICLDGAHC
ncbi:MAG: NUDIX hydrolase [Chloroflexi bacterium]|nr:NUDIX hydrolase [Chloroflexota bacterium]MBP7043196.1 NUDIX hydrolase [Chloroflexota bacterium]